MTPRMTKTELLERVQALGGFEREADASAAIEATLEALGAVLMPEERRSVSEKLSPSLRDLFETSAHFPDSDLAAFCERVQRREGVVAGRAREHAQVVCQALSEALPFEVVTLLRRHLPKLASLFELPEPTSAPDVPERDGLARPFENRKDTTLASGRPGSRHPLSDADPDRAQSHSVARSDDPHGDTKLSSAQGSTQERERETLATGRPGPKRTLSG